MAKVKKNENNTEEPIEKQLWKAADKFCKDNNAVKENGLDKFILSNLEKINVEGRYAR